MRSSILIILSSAAMWTAPAQQAPPARVPKVAAPSTSYVGVMMQEIDTDRARALKLPSEAGVEVTRVEPDSPADHAGVKVNDVILQFNGQHVEGIEQFSRLVRETPAGREVKMDIYRNGSPQSLTVKVGARRAPAAMTMMNPIPAPAPAPMPPAERFELRMPDMPRSFMSWRSSALGLECETLEGQLAQYFGVKEGVLVRSVAKSSPAEKAGVKAGDVIVRVDDSRVATPSDVSSRIRSNRGKPVPFVVMRDHREVTVSVTLDDEDRVGNWWPQDFAPVAPRAREQ